MYTCRYRDEQAKLKKAFDLENGIEPKPKTKRTRSAGGKPSAYNNFVKQNYEAAKSKVKEPKQAFTELGKQWKSLSDAEKQKYK